MYRIKSIILSVIILVSVTNTSAQTSQEHIVDSFGDYMSSWCKSGDDTYREKIDNLVQGDKGCRVNDGIMKIFVSKDETGLLSTGTTFIDNYLNGFTHAIDDDLVYTHGIPVWQKNYTEPVAFSDKTEAPLFFVSMDVTTKGAFDFCGTDLFFVRGGQITKIVDFNDANSLAKAIELYSSHKYEEAFKLFRKLAYEDPGNYDAQYYTAVMEIKKQGCNFLGNKVRDMEAAWWLTRGVVAYSLYEKRERMAKLYMRFAVDENPLPFNTMGRDFYMMSLITRQLVTEGLMAYKNKGLYGFMDESGKLVIPCKYNLVYPFDKSGHALVVKDGKIGYINKRGVEIVPIKYESGVAQFKEGKTYVILEDTLLLIDEHGSVLMEVGKGYDSLNSVFVGGKAYAHHKTSKLFYLHDINGNITSVEKESYFVDFLENCYYTKDANGKRLYEESFGWK